MRRFICFHELRITQGLADQSPMDPSWYILTGQGKYSLLPPQLFIFFIFAARTSIHDREGIYE